MASAADRALTLSFVENDSAGGWLAILLAVGSVGSAIWLQLAGHGKDYRWLRWPLAAAVLVGALLASSTPAWPDGLRLQSCKTIANPAASTTVECEGEHRGLFGPAKYRRTSPASDGDGPYYFCPGARRARFPRSVLP